MASLGRILAVSPFYETEPVDCPPGSGAFLNGVAIMEWQGGPHELLERLREIECALGRPAQREWHAPRPLDLDILYAGEAVMDTPDLILPHPRIAQRRFVLEPLADVRPGLVLPGQTRTVAELLALLD